MAVDSDALEAVSPNGRAQGGIEGLTEGFSLFERVCVRGLPIGVGADKGRYWMHIESQDGELWFVTGPNYGNGRSASRLMCAEARRETVAVHGLLTVTNPEFKDSERYTMEAVEFMIGDQVYK